MIRPILNHGAGAKPKQKQKKQNPGHLCCRALDRNMLCTRKAPTEPQSTPFVNNKNSSRKHHPNKKRVRACLGQTGMLAPVPPNETTHGQPWTAEDLPVPNSDMWRACAGTASAPHTNLLLSVLGGVVDIITELRRLESIAGKQNC